MSIHNDNNYHVDDDDLRPILAAQRREMAAAQSVDADLDYAFDLQLQEAITASLSLLVSTSKHQPPPPPPLQQQKQQNDAVPLSLQSNEISKLEQELTDRTLTKREFSKLKEDLHRRLHDQNLAREILQIPEREWLDWGDQFEKPFVSKPSCSASVNNRNCNDNSGVGEEVFRLYFKGLVSQESVGGESIGFAGIGVAVCDSFGHLVFEIRKPLLAVNGLNKVAAEATALIEGLQAVASLELERVDVFCDCYPLYQFLTGRWPPKQRKVAILLNQVSTLRRKFTCKIKLVARNDIKYAFKLAKDAIISQVTRPAESSHGKAAARETCIICLEDTDGENMFSVDVCKHRFCFSCMKQHVEVKLLHGLLPKCPHENCKSELKVESCKKFLTARLIETMTQRIKEAAIPVTEKVYCPYPKCSVLMSKKDINQNTVNCSGARKCLKCNGLFCVNCKVPWHNSMTCFDYRRMNPNPPGGDMKLKSLAARNLWRQCVKCNHMIELAEGCYHMTCRCGYEFCYNCGAEWKNKKATCSCPLWDEDNILFDDEEFDNDDEGGLFDEYDSDEFHDSDASDDYLF